MADEKPHPRDHPKYSGPLGSVWRQERDFYDAVGWDVKPRIEEHDDEFASSRKKDDDG